MYLGADASAACPYTAAPPQGAVAVRPDLPFWWPEGLSTAVLRARALLSMVSAQMAVDTPEAALAGSRGHRTRHSPPETVEQAHAKSTQGPPAVPWF